MSTLHPCMTHAWQMLPYQQLKCYLVFKSNQSVGFSRILEKERFKFRAVMPRRNGGRGGGAYKSHHARHKSVKRGPQRRRRPSACEPSERFYYIYLISWIGKYYNYVELHLFLIMYKKRELRGTRDWLFLTVLTINILIPDWMILIRVDIYLNT